MSIPKKETRAKQIEDALKAADNGSPRPQEPTRPNPYPPGSARAKMWDRREKKKKE